MSGDETSREPLLATSGETPTKTNTPRGVYKFEFSNTSSLVSKAFCLTLLLVVVFTALIGIPTIIEYETVIAPTPKQFSRYSLLMYVMALNGMLLLLGGRCIVSVISYPYSSHLFRRNLARTTNQKFGEEFKRCVNKLVDVAEQLTLQGEQDPIVSDILLGTQDGEYLESQGVDEEGGQVTL